MIGSCDVGQHKGRILDALKRGYDRGARSADMARPAAFDPEAAWTAIVMEIPNIRRAKQCPDRVYSGKRGRPSGRMAQDPVALLAPIYRRFTGAKVTASHAHGMKRKPLIAYGGAAPVRRKKLQHTCGPFVAFVQAVSEACGLRLSAASIDKMFDILAANSERDDGLAEAQCRFSSTYRTVAEIYAGVKLD